MTLKFFSERVSARVLSALGEVRSFDAGDLSTGGTTRECLEGLICCAGDGVASGVFFRGQTEGRDLGRDMIMGIGSLKGDGVVYWGVEGVEGDGAGC